MCTPRGLGRAWLLALSAFASRAYAQQAYQGFGVDRIVPSAPGAGWFVMDALDMRGGPGGVFALNVGYARNPLRIPNGSQNLAVVSDLAVSDFGAAIIFDRLRFWLDFSMPLVITGDSGTVGGYSVAGPSLTVATNPDTFSDVRLGLDARIFGSASGPFRIGAGAMLLVPSGRVTDFDTDGTYRGMLRVLFAGDVGAFTYAGHLGVHLRVRNDGAAPESPQGSEALFGVAAGARIMVNQGIAVIVGPELDGATALQSMFGPTSSALEGLVGARVEGTARRGLQVRFRVAAGAGLYQHFGAPEWRAVLGFEVFNRDLRP